jgi:hypothetical protein
MLTHRGVGDGPGLLNHPIFKYRAAVAEMLGLVRGILGISQVHEIEVDVLDFGATQIGTAEIGLADFFSGFDVLIIVIVGVEPSTASLTGYWATYEAVARRPEVKAHTPQVGIAEIGSRPVNIGQSGIAQIGSNEISLRHR